MNSGLQLPESPITRKDQQLVGMLQAMLLTDNTVVVAWFNVGHLDFDSSEQNTEIGGQRV